MYRQVVRNKFVYLCFPTECMCTRRGNILEETPPPKKKNITIPLSCLRTACTAWDQRLKEVLRKKPSLNLGLFNMPTGPSFSHCFYRIMSMSTETALMAWDRRLEEVLRKKPSLSLGLFNMRDVGRTRAFPTVSTELCVWAPGKHWWHLNWMACPTAVSNHFCHTQRRKRLQIGGGGGEIGCAPVPV
jgi:hypothetical protein